VGFRKTTVENSLKILVTGNLGYVGSHLTELLIASGHEVIGCDLSIFPEAVCGELSKPSLQLIKDFRSLTSPELNGVEAIAHLAGISNDPMGELNPGLTTSINGEGTIHLAKVAQEAGVKIFAFASSCSIYGSAGNQPRTEDDPTNPLSEYALSKLYAEEGLAKLATQNFHVYLLRNATAYGSSSVFRTDLVVNDLSVGMLINRIAEVKSDGSPWRPLIHCLDMARAFKEFIEKDPKIASGVPINIGFNEENFQVRDVANLVKMVWVDGECRFGNSELRDSRNYKVSFDRLRSIFPDFKPVFPLREGIRNLRDFLLQIDYSENDYSSGRFTRIVELKKNIYKLS